MDAVTTGGPCGTSAALKQSADELSSSTGRPSISTPPRSGVHRTVTHGCGKPSTVCRQPLTAKTSVAMGTDSPSIRTPDDGAEAGVTRPPCGQLITEPLLTRFPDTTHLPVLVVLVAVVIASSARSAGPR